MWDKRWQTWWNGDVWYIVLESRIRKLTHWEVGCKSEEEEGGGRNCSRDVVKEPRSVPVAVLLKLKSKSIFYDNMCLFFCWAFYIISTGLLTYPIILSRSFHFINKVTKDSKEISDTQNWLREMHEWYWKVNGIWSWTRLRHELDLEPVRWPWARCFSALCFSACICTLGMEISSSQSCYEDTC